MRTRVVSFREEAGKNPNLVYIGRAGHGQDGYFGNPHISSTFLFCPQCRKEGLGEVTHEKRGDAAKAFAQTFLRRMQSDSTYRKRVETELRGKDLGCFCGYNSPTCHGMVYVRYFEKMNE